MRAWKKQEEYKRLSCKFHWKWNEIDRRIFSIALRTIATSHERIEI